MRVEKKKLLPIEFIDTSHNSVPMGFSKYISALLNFSIFNISVHLIVELIWGSLAKNSQTQLILVNMSI